MIIAGLGNPGPEYAQTRHNAGFWAADAIADKFRVKLNSCDHQAQTGELILHGQSHLLVKPQTYMNLSGESIAGLMLEHGLAPADLMVILDDINLPIGRIRIRSAGSDGGHNGLKSIINHIGRNFWRLRIGVGQPVGDGADCHGNLVSHVLGAINEADQKIFNKLMQEMPDMVAMWLLGMGNTLMTRFNGRDFAISEESDGKKE